MAFCYMCHLDLIIGILLTVEIIHYSIGIISVSFFSENRLDIAIFSGLFIPRFSSASFYWANWESTLPANI